MSVWNLLLKRVSYFVPAVIEKGLTLLKIITEEELVDFQTIMSSQDSMSSSDGNTRSHELDSPSTRHPNRHPLVIHSLSVRHPPDICTTKSLFLFRLRKASPLLPLPSTNMGKLTVHGLNISICSRTVFMALEEKGAKYDIKPVNLLKAEHKSPEFLTKQPFGQVPVLFDDDFKVYETTAICRYIDDTLPGRQLVPKDAKQKALVEQWVSIEESNFGAAKTLVFELVLKGVFGLTTDNAVVEANKVKLQEFLKIFDEHLKGKSFIVGDDFTLAGKLLVDDSSRFGVHRPH